MSESEDSCSSDCCKKETPSCEVGEDPQCLKEESCEYKEESCQDNGESCSSDCCKKETPSCEVGEDLQCLKEKSCEYKEESCQDNGCKKIKNNKDCRKQCGKQMESSTRKENSKECEKEDCNDCKKKDSCETGKKSEMDKRALWWRNFAIFLGCFTIIYNTAEGAVSIFYGSDDGSLSLLGFGIDSIIEVLSGCLVLWRFIWIGKTNHQSLRKERIATASIGLMLAALGIGTVTTAVYNLVMHNKPSDTVAGALITASSVLIMITLYCFKRHASRVLDSATLASDAKCSMSCIKLSLVVFFGSGIFWLDSELWWIDSAAAILISIFIAAEGINTARHAFSKDFAGGCGCDSSKPKHPLLKLINYIL